jgi:MFS transporter, CP family, cyanate transporter
MTNRDDVASRPLPTGNMLLVAGIILVAFNLRPALTSVGPLIGSIRTDTGLSGSMAGFLTTLPLIAFAVLSPIAPKIAERYGNERTIWAGLCILLVGIILRSLGGTAALFAGMGLIGLGIAISNVLLPGLVKQRFPDRIGLMTSVYTTAMGTLAALASGLSVPLAQTLHLGWQGALACWSLLTLVALVVWLPQLRASVHITGDQGKASDSSRLWRSPLAWQVTVFMGLQSFAFYCTIAWLPEILHHHGMSTSTAGWMLSILQFISLPATFLAPVLATRMTNQMGMALVIGLCFLAGFGGLLVGENSLLLFGSLVLLGIGLGASISLAMTMIVLRTTDTHQASALSGMSQSVGYLLAAVGPILIGLFYDWTGSWTFPLLTLLAVSLLMTIAAVGAGRNKYV